ncbi:Hypothetical protein NGAL_HAMBI2605_64470 [Neorhizobium galegae bv. orientalis]|uniref:hypothetical protein n=1 Tax=Rhizobium leguminosarum TaxID=384 RepID=UPI000621124A|nr:Hypothetical protein NGAL_HAMBI2605_64470 [Neorhizobium galegae bv. orientalis]
MSSELKKQLQDFERQLDAALDALPSRLWDSTSALRMGSELYEIGAFKNGIDGAGYISFSRLSARSKRGMRRRQSSFTEHVSPS